MALSSTGPVKNSPLGKLRFPLLLINVRFSIESVRSVPSPWMRTSFFPTSQSTRRCCCADSSFQRAIGSGSLRKHTSKTNSSKSCRDISASCAYPLVGYSVDDQRNVPACSRFRATSEISRNADRRRDTCSGFTPLSAFVLLREAIKSRASQYAATAVNTGDFLVSCCSLPSRKRISSRLSRSISGKG